MDNPQQYQRMHAQGGQPYAPGGIARSLGFLRTLVPQAIVLAAGVIVAEAALPPSLKPSTLLGHFHGSLDTAEINAKQGAVVRLEEEMTTARTAPPANWQMEAQIAAQQQQAVAEALQGQAGMANLADTSCILGGVLGALNINPDWNNVGKAMAGACGVGDGIRANMADTLAKTGRDNSALVQRSAPK